MKRVAIAFFIVAFTGFLFSGCEGSGVASSTGTGTTTPIPTAVNEPEYCNEMYDLINEERAANGLGALQRHSQLEAVADSHAEVMRDCGYIFHDGGPDGTPTERVQSAGITFTGVGENCVKMKYTAEMAMDSFMNSSEHRANILHPDFTHVGIGLAMPGFYWCQNFIRN